MGAFREQTFTIDPSALSDKEKNKLMFDRYLNGEIDIETYKRSLDLLLHDKHREVDDKHIPNNWLGSYIWPGSYDMRI